MKKFIIKMIRVYQKTLSPDHGWFAGNGKKVCRFHPTCSEYMIGSIEEFGVTQGTIRGFWRILRCNPWNKGGLDPVKTNTNKIEYKIQKPKLGQRFR